VVYPLLQIKLVIVLILSMELKGQSEQTEKAGYLQQNKEISEQSR
jgi:hypothetical protein